MRIRRRLLSAQMGHDNTETQDRIFYAYSGDYFFTHAAEIIVCQHGDWQDIFRQSRQTDRQKERERGRERERERERPLVSAISNSSFVTSSKSFAISVTGKKIQKPVYRDLSKSACRGKFLINEYGADLRNCASLIRRTISRSRFVKQTPFGWRCAIVLGSWPGIGLGCVQRMTMGRIPLNEVASRVCHVRVCQKKQNILAHRNTK